MAKAPDRGMVALMCSAASRTLRRCAGLTAATALAALAVFAPGPGSAMAQACLPAQQPPPPPPIDLPPPPPPGRHELSTGPSVLESAGSMKFTLSLPADQCTATISYHTVDGTATAGQDYVSRSGEVTVDFADPEATVTVPILDDALDEADETFSLSVSGGDGGGTATIVDDDQPPSITVGSPTVDEGTGAGGTEVFPVTLSAPSGLPVAVAYATADGTATGGTDYQPTSGTLTFAPGTTKQSVAVPLVGDAAAEPNESFDLVLSAPHDATLATTTALATIVNDDAAPGGAGAHSTAPPPSPLADIGPPLLVISAPVETAGAVVWTITCPPAEQSCTGRVKITTDPTHKRRAAVAARRRSHLVKLGAANYSLSGGETKRVRVPINNKGKRLIRKRHTVPANATFKTRDRAGNVSQRTQHITLHPVILRHS